MRPRPRGRMLDKVRVVGAALVASLWALMRRMVGWRRRRGWSIGYEALVSAYRGRISPLFADLAKLPPILIHAGEAEVLIDQIRALAQRASAAGIDARLSVYPDMVHVWHMFKRSESRRAIAEVGAFIAAHTSATKPSLPGLPG